MARLNRITILFALIILALPLSNAAIEISTNCSHITVTTDQTGGLVDIEYNGAIGWAAIYSMESVVNGKVVKPTLFNGSHRAFVRPNVNSPPSERTYSNAIEVTTCAPQTPCATNSDCETGEVCVGSVCITGECASNGGCSANEYCQTNNMCAQVQCACGEIVNHACNEYECCSDNDCSGGKICSNNVCVEESTGECTANSDCPSDRKCQNNICVIFPCACGEIVNHACNEYECCSDNDCSGGKICSNNVCAGGGEDKNDTVVRGTQGSGSEVGLYCIGGVAVFFIFMIGIFLVIALVAAVYKRET
ncbi:MAG: hypothetical protein ABIG39_06980 [Candidatus Micrarchaeota archaeon]